MIKFSEVLNSKHGKKHEKMLEKLTKFLVENDDNELATYEVEVREELDYDCDGERPQFNRVTIEVVFADEDKSF